MNAQNTRSSRGIIIAIIITALVIGGIVYAWQILQLQSAEETVPEQVTSLETEMEQQQEAEQQEQSASQNESTNQQSEQADELVYTNSEFGFSITFPETWEGFIAQDRSWSFGELGLINSVDFGFDVQDSIFNISWYTKSIWEQVSAEEGPKPTYLGENDQYVFAYATGQDAANDTIIERMSEIPDIIATFRVSQ